MTWCPAALPHSFVTATGALRGRGLWIVHTPNNPEGHLMKRLLLTSAIALLAATGAAAAADLIVEQPMVAAAPVAAGDWEGFYAGIVGGLGSGTVDYTDIGAMASADPSISGGMIGGTIGYNAQFDSMILGIEGDLSWANLNGSRNTGAAGVIFQGNVNWLGTLRGRVGIDLDPVLLYATAGLATGAVTTTLSGAQVGGPFTTTHVGYTVGGGAEFKVTEDVSVKAEYLYTDLGRRDIPAGALWGVSTANTAQASFHAIRVGANFHF
jgi:outer membrane immunogenic protein